jgi:hypothetical protein
MIFDLAAPDEFRGIAAGPFKGQLMIFMVS